MDATLFVSYSNNYSIITDIQRSEAHRAELSEILQALSRGTGIKAAAAELLISPTTVRTHVRRIMQRTGTRSYKEALILAKDAGLLD